MFFITALYSEIDNMFNIFFDHDSRFAHLAYRAVGYGQNKHY